MAAGEIVVVQDTREQKPYTFRDVPTKIRTLQEGDYTAEGVEHLIRIERKGSIADLAGCVGSGRDRFERELERLLVYPRRFLLCEFTLQELLAWHPPRCAEFSRTVQGVHLVGSVLAWAGRFGIHPLFTGTRALGAATCLKLLRFAVKDAARDVDASRAASATGPS